MAKGVNKVFLLGNVGKDPEIRSTAGGMTVASFTLATADRKKEGANWVDSTEWHNIVCFQRTAEIVRDYVKKGSQLFVEGKITNRSWDDKEAGQKKYRTEIIVSDFTFVGGGKPAGEGAVPGGYSKSNTSSFDQRPAANQADYADVGITDDDIPF